MKQFLLILTTIILMTSLTAQTVYIDPSGTYQLDSKSKKKNGESELAAKIDGLTDDQLKDIGRIAAKHIFRGGYVAKTITYGAIEYFEGKVREPKRKKRDLSFYATKP